MSAGSAVTFPIATRNPGAGCVPPLQAPKRCSLGGKRQKLGSGVGEIGDVPGPCRQDGQRVQKPFPWTIPPAAGTVASAPHVSSSALPAWVWQHGWGEQDQPRCPEHQGLGWGPAQGHGAARVGRAVASWLCPEEMALGECRCHADAERRADKGCAWEVCLVNWVGILCLPHSQPLLHHPPAPAAAWGPLG